MRTAEEDRTQAEAQRDFDLLQEDEGKAYNRIKTDWQRLVAINEASQTRLPIEATEDDWKLIRWAMGIK